MKWLGQRRALRAPWRSAQGGSRSATRFTLLAAAALLATTAARADEPVVTLHADAGWFEEAFAVDDAGGRLALVRTGENGESELELLDLGQKGAVLARAPLTGPPPSELVFTRGGVLVLTRTDAGVAGTIVDAAGKPGARFGPATDIARSERGGRELVAVHTVRGTTHQIALHDLAKPKPIAVRTLAADASGHVAALDFTVRQFRASGTQVAGRRPGRYDKKLDQRLNDTEALYDLVDGAFVRDAPPADLVTQVKVARARDRHPGLDGFVTFTEDRARLVRVGGDDSFTPLELAVSAYDAESLAQAARGDEIVFSLAVDPLNPEALARKKRDAEVIDFYRLAPGAPPVRVARIPRDGRELLWRAGGSRLALLRKHRSFGRGGPDLEIYDLARSPAP